MSIASLESLASDDAHLRERCVSSREVYRGHFLEVYRDEITLPDGGHTGREYMRHPGAVMIIPLLDDGRLVMERQFRYPLDRAMLEFPAGKLEPGEPGIVCGVRELFEETGFTAREWAYAGQLHNAIAYCDEHIQIWFARGLQAALEPAPFGPKARAVYRPGSGVWMPGSSSTCLRPPRKNWQAGCWMAGSPMPRPASGCSGCSSGAPVPGL